MAAADDGGRIEIRLLGDSHPDFPLVSAVRRRVFVEEQKVPEEEEWDEQDAVAVHLLALLNGEAVGTLRFYNDGGWLHIGRVAVLESCRGRGVGRLLVERCLTEGRRLGYAEACLNAQSDKAGFYRRFGFIEIGDEFMEAGIPHLRMEMFFGK